MRLPLLLLAVLSAVLSFAAAGPAPSLPTGPQAAVLLRAMADAGAHGLDASAFAPAGVDPMLASSDPMQRQEGLRRVRAAAERYASAVHSGALPASAFERNWALKPEPFDPAPSLDDALAQDRLEAWLTGLAPPQPAYRALQAGLERYRRYAAAGGWKPLPSGRALHVGDQDARIALLRTRLAAEGWIVSGAATGPIFEEDLAAALTDWQRAHGVEADGVLGPATVAALNVPAEARIGQIAANLERLRWSARNPPSTRIEVDSGSATLSYYRGGLLTMTMRTIVGRPGDPTPMFADQVETVVINPPWNVPVTIAVKEILPKVRRDAAYLAKNDFVYRDGPGPPEARLQQRAGPKSALGLYKFDMPNGFNVYLHDTPARTLFDGDRRNLSHGCIRLQKPRELAELVLGDEGITPADIQAAVDAGATRRFPLRRPVPVTVSHWTATAGMDGRINFRPDLYRWDARIAAALR